MVLVLALGCASPGDTGVAWSYPMDDTLRFTDVQAVGTHNSYHMRTEGVELDAWDYEHAPLDVQLGEQGVRQFELDICFDAALERFEVYHAPVIDDQTTCLALTDCVATVRAWSAAHPGHQLLWVHL